MQIARSPRPYQSFTDRQGTWLPIFEVKKKYPWWRNLEKWVRRNFCVYLPNGRLPKRRKIKILCGGGPRPIYVGAPREFFLQEDLDLIDANMSKPATQHAVGQETVSWPESKELGFTNYLFWEVANKQKDPQKENRVVERNGRKFQRKVRVVCLADLVAEKEKELNDLPNQPKLILPSQAVTRTKKAFSLSEMEYWETHTCPHLGRSLAVTNRDMLLQQKKKVRGKTRLNKYFRSGVKHYFQDEIDEAYRNYLAKKALRKSSSGTGQLDGRTIMTAGAIYREHGLSEQLIENARDKGWLEAARLKRKGSGSHGKSWWYYEDGDYGVTNLKSLPRGSHREILWPAEKEPLSPEALAKNAKLRDWPVFPGNGEPINGSSENGKRINGARQEQNGQSMLATGSERGQPGKRKHGGRTKGTLGKRTQEQYRKIKQAFREETNISELARRFKVSRKTVHRALWGKS